MSRSSAPIHPVLAHIDKQDPAVIDLDSTLRELRNLQQAGIDLEASAAAACSSQREKCALRSLILAISPSDVHYYNIIYKIIS
jgi:hypothetical protein